MRQVSAGLSERGQFYLYVQARARRLLQSGGGERTVEIVGQHEIVVENDTQIANFADFCNDCGNCDTFCPEYDGPFIKKPNFFGSFAAWSAFDKRDGFFIDATGSAPRMHGRIKGRTYLLERESGWAGHRFEDGEVCLFLRDADHVVERWFAFGPHDSTGHLVDMTAYHTMRILLASLLRTDRIHQVNVRLVP